MFSDSKKFETFRWRLRLDNGAGLGVGARRSGGDVLAAAGPLGHGAHADRLILPGGAGHRVREWNTRGGHTKYNQEGFRGNRMPSLPSELVGDGHITFPIRFPWY